MGVRPLIRAAAAGGLLLGGTVTGGSAQRELSFAASHPVAGRIDEAVLFDWRNVLGRTPDLDFTWSAGMMFERGGGWTASPGLGIASRVKGSGIRGIAGVSGWVGFGNGERPVEGLGGEVFAGLRRVTRHPWNLQVEARLVAWSRPAFEPTVFIGLRLVHVVRPREPGGP